jgi:hypothetical protein
MWKLGWGSRKHRPDRLGLLAESPAEGCGIFVKETRKDALQSKEGTKVFNALRAQAPVFLTTFLAPYAKVFTGTKEDLQKIMEKLAKMPGTLGDAVRRRMLEKASLEAESIMKHGQEINLGEAVE